MFCLMLICSAFFYFFNGPLGDQLSQDLPDQSSPDFEEWVQIMDLESDLRFVIAEWNFKAKLVKLAHPTRLKATFAVRHLCNTSNS